MSEQVVVQSFTDFKYNFPVYDKAGILVHTIVIPSKTQRPKNILIVPQEQFEEIRENKTFKNLLKQKLVRILDKVPADYWDASQQVAQAKAEKEEALSLVNGKDVLLSEKEFEIARLRKQIEDMGGAQK